MLKKLAVAMACLPMLAMNANAHQGQGEKSLFQAPSLASGVGFYEKHRNEQLAAWSLRQIYDSLPVVNDPWSEQVIHQMSGHMNGLVRQLPLYSVLLINDNNINAFAVPGGLIGMNTGTIIGSQTMDEVASVLAHEIAHISQRHYEHQLDNQKKLLAMQLGGLLAAIAAGAAGGGGDAALVAMAGSQTASAEGAAVHSREHEREADRVGMQILAQAGYDAAAMPRFFERLQKQHMLNQGKGSFVPSFVQSHPFTSERLSEATARASAYRPPVMTAKQEQEKLFDQWVWRLKYLTKQTTHTQLVAHANQSIGARLALATYLADNHRHQEASEVMKAGDLNPFDPLVCVTQAHLLAAKKDYAGAVLAIKPCQLIYPERRDLRLYLAQHHIHADQPTDALVLLNDLTQDGSHDVQAWQLAQQAYQKLAQLTDDEMQITTATIHALRARSQVALWHGQYQESLKSLAQAQQVAKRDDDRLATLSALLEKDKQAVMSAKEFKPK